MKLITIMCHTLEYYPTYGSMVLVPLNWEVLLYFFICELGPPICAWESRWDHMIWDWKHHLLYSLLCYMLSTMKQIWPSHYSYLEITRHFDYWCGCSLSHGFLTDRALSFRPHGRLRHLCINIRQWEPMITVVTPPTIKSTVG